MSLGAHFERSVRWSFDFLVREHSFAKPKVGREGYQYTVLDYVKGSLRVRANFDMEETILVEVSVWDGPVDVSDPFGAQFSFLLDSLAAHRNPAWVRPPQPSPDEWTNEQIDRVVDAYARAFRVYGSDFLAGDTTGLAAFLADHPNLDRHLR